MMNVGSPTTCFGETLKAGTMRLAEFLVIKSVMLLIIFLIDTATIFTKDYNDKLYYIIPIVLLVLSIVKVGCNFALYYGALYGKPAYMKPWLWLYSVQTVLLIVCGVGGCIAMNFLYQRIATATAYIFVGVLIYCMASKYFCQVVLGLIREMERGNVYNDAIRPDVFSNQIA